MSIWFNSRSVEAEVLTYLLNVEKAGFDELIDAIFGERPRGCEPAEALELDAKSASFFSAMGDLLHAGYVSTAPNHEAKQIYFSLRSAEETEILLRECAGND